MIGSGCCSRRLCGCKCQQQADAYVPEAKDEIDSLLEKPIGQWSNDEVKAFAEAKGIDVDLVLSSAYENAKKLFGI